MMNFALRRGLGVAVLIATTVVVVRWRPVTAYVSGWLLFALMIALTVFNARKKLPFLPLMSSEAWLQFHIYAGLFSAAVFFVHIGWHMPHGWFQGTLAALYVLVMLSGIVGLVWSRTLPKRLTTRGGEVLYERISAVRRALQEQAEALALPPVAEARSVILAEFYAENLAGFFDGAHNFWRHLLESRAPLNELLARTDNLSRYLNDSERSTMEKIATLARQKDGLDYQYALQVTLKGWLFVHIPLTYSLLLVSIVHVVLVYAFSGGAP
jgi:hypothetical protein